MKIIGEVKRVSDDELIFEWKIKDFSAVLDKEIFIYDSPPFYFASASWCLRFFQYGLPGTEGSTGVYLTRNSSGTELNLDIFIGIKTLDGKITPATQKNYDFVEGCGTGLLLNRSLLLENKSIFFPSNVLSVVCKVMIPKCIRFGNSTTATKVTAKQHHGQDYNRKIQHESKLYADLTDTVLDRLSKSLCMLYHSSAFPYVILSSILLLSGIKNMFSK